MKRNKKSDDNIKSTRQAVSIALGIPIEHVNALKQLGCNGCSTTGRYYLKEIRAWYDANKEVVEEFLRDNEANEGGDINEYKARLIKARALSEEMDLKEKQGKTLDKEQVISFLKQIAGSQAIMLRNMSQEVPHRILGKNITEIQVELQKTYDVICNKFKESLEKWNQTPQ